MVDVLVAIVSFRSGPQIEELLPSIGRTTAALTTVIANNAVGDDLSPLSNRFNATILEMGSNRGYGSAINEAVRRTEGSPDWILVVNPDVTFVPGAIDALVDIGESDSRTGSVGPQILTAEGEVYPSARQLPSLRTGVGHALLSRIWRDNPWTHRYRTDRESPPRRRDAGWLSGACVLIRGTLFKQLGGFDEGYFMYFEDVDLGRRIGRAGFRNVYAPTAIVTHTGAHATRSSGRAMIRAHHASAYRYMAEDYRGWYLAPLRAVLRIGLAVRSYLVRSS